jgi:isopenicillin N synthase-like dioxygenase
MNFDSKTIATIDDVPIIDMNEYFNGDPSSPETQALCT